jgi:hypothetical protein
MDTQTRQATRSEDTGTFDMEGEKPVLVRPGVYDLKFLYYETSMMFGRQPKLCLVFSICTMGDYFEVQVKRHYNVSKLVGKPGRYGGFKASWRGDFIREFASLFGLPQRLDRIPMSSFQNPMFQGVIKTVDHGSNQRPLPKELHYSVICQLRSKVGRTIP